MLTIARRAGGPHQGGGRPRPGDARRLDGGARHRGAATAPSWPPPSLAWSPSPCSVVIPRYNAGEGSEFVDRYGSLGSDGGGVATTLLTRPWEAARAGRLLRPAQLPRGPAAAAAAAAAGGAPAPGGRPARDADQHPRRLVPAVLDPVPVRRGDRALRGGRRRSSASARVRRATPPGAARAPARRHRAAWPPSGWAPSRSRASTSARCHGGATCRSVGSSARVEQYRVTDHSRAMARAVALVPDDVPVSAGNLLGAHLSERERIYTFPVIAGRAMGAGQPRPALPRRPALCRAAHAVRLRRCSAPARTCGSCSTRTASWCSGAHPPGARVNARAPGGGAAGARAPRLAVLPGFAWFTGPRPARRPPARERLRRGRPALAAAGPRRADRAAPAPASSSAAPGPAARSGALGRPARRWRRAWSRWASRSGPRPTRRVTLRRDPGGLTETVAGRRSPSSPRPSPRPWSPASRRHRGGRRRWVGWRR